MSEGNTATLLAARAIYKKTEGYLYLTDYPFRIVWVHPETGEPLVQLLTQDCTNLFANKTGVKPPKLKIVANDVDHNFVFTGEEPQCFVNRDAFRDQVKILIRESMTQATPAGPSEVATPEQATTPTAMEEDTPEPSTLPPPPAVTIPTIDPAKELAAKIYRLRKRILVRDPELAVLHNAVVIAGKMSEADFWASRQYLLDEAAITDAQKKGKSSRLVDPKPGVSASGDIKISITPQLIQEIFDEWPVVKRVWVENVPTNMTKEEFWKRYFESQLYHNHRASVRSTATQHVVKADTIFDKYLEPVDNELQPRYVRNDAVNRLVDLAATQEDHAETGNIRDVTMQAGKQKTSLPLMRKFNEHSERLLNTALGAVHPVRRSRLEHMDDINDYDEIDIEDLHGGGDDSGIPLDMQNRQRYFEGRSGTSGGPVIDSVVALSALKGQLSNWEYRLKTVRLDGQAGAEAFKAISSNISSRTKVKSSRLNVPPEFLKQMRTIESTTNEYLRQFWFLVYPPPEGVKRPPPEERAQKIGVMRDRLLVNQKRIEDLVTQAATNRWDKNGVSEAFKPTLNAVDKAVKFVAGKR